MKIDEKGIDLLKDLEGLRLTAYQCSAGRWTIGYGHTSNAGAPTVVPGQKLTKDEADKILRRDVAYFENELSPLITGALNQGQWNAVVSFAYNVGIPAFSGSTLRKKINDGRLSDVPAEMMKWTKYTNPTTKMREELKGLVIRRRAECGMWRSLDDPGEVKEGDMRLAAVAPEPVRNVAQSKEATASIATTMAGSLLVATEMKKQLDDAAGLVDAFLNASKNPSFVIACTIALISMAIFYWRRKRLVEEETA